MYHALRARALRDLNGQRCKAEAAEGARNALDGQLGATHAQSIATIIYFEQHKASYLNGLTTGTIAGH
jgi:hypothetical protein